MKIIGAFKTPRINLASQSQANRKIVEAAEKQPSNPKPNLTLSASRA